MSIDFDGACDPYFILHLLQESMSEQTKKPTQKLLGQADVVYNLFYSYSNPENQEIITYHPGTLSRWFSGKAPISKNIVSFYENNPELFQSDIQNHVFPKTESPQKLVDLLIAAYNADEYIPEIEKYDFLRMYTAQNANYGFSQNSPDGMNEQMAHIAAHILLSSFKTHYPLRDPKTHKLYKSLAPVKRLVNYVPVPCDPFYGRTAELVALDDLLTEKKKVFLHGLPGMGKSELARAYAHTPEFNQKYNNIIYITYSGNLTVDIASLHFLGEDKPSLYPALSSENIPSPLAFATSTVVSLCKQNFVPPSYDSRYYSHLQLLRTLTENDLLIIDNFNVLPYSTSEPLSVSSDDMTFQEETKFPDIFQLPCRQLYCTRCNPAAWSSNFSSNCLELQPLDRESLLKLINYNFPQASAYKKEITGIIRILHSNTLLVKLASVLFHTSAMDPKQILEKLEEESLKTDIPEHIGAEIKGKFYSETFAAHARLLFKLYLLSTHQQDILRSLTLLPLSGVHFRHFCSWLKLDNADVLNDLISIGLLNKDQKEKIFLHPLIQQVAICETNPSIENCSVILDSFCQLCFERMDSKKLKCADELNTIASIISNIQKTGSRESQDQYLMFLENTIPFLQQHHRYSQANDVIEHTCDYLQKNTCGTDADRIITNAFLQLRRNDPLKAIWILIVSLLSGKFHLTPNMEKLLYEKLMYNLKTLKPLKFDSAPQDLKELMLNAGQERWLKIHLYGIVIMLQRINDHDKNMLLLDMTQKHNSYFGEPLDQSLIQE